MYRSLVRISFIAVCCLVARGAVAEEGLSPEAQISLERLRASAGLDISTVVEGGRVSWAGRLMMATSSDDSAFAARDLLQRHGVAFGVRDINQLEVVDVRDHLGTRYVELRPRHLGVPVLGGQVVVSMRDGWIQHVASGLRQWEGPTSLPAPISATDAARAVMATSGRGAIVPTPADLAWLPLPGRPGQLLLVWIVEQREVAPAHDWRYIVEATKGAVLWRSDQILRAEGYVYDTNPVTAGGEVTRVELYPLDEGTEALEGELARSFRCVAQTGDCSMMGTDCRICGEVDRLATIQEDGNFLYMPDEPNLADPFAEVQGYYHASLINQFFSDVLGYERTCGGSRAITIYVNQHEPGDEERSANAGYGDADGDGCGDLILGEGLGIDFSYDAEVIYHEFTHGVIESLGGLGCAPFGLCPDELGIDSVPYGLNEGFSDYFSVTVSDDPNLGEHSGLAFPGDPFVRTVDNDFMCPFDIIGEQHYDGQILGGLGWDVRQLVGAEVADQMMLQTLMTIVSTSGYAEVAAALRIAAQAEVDAGSITADDLDEIERLMGQEGRGITDCRRIVPLDAIPDGHHLEYLPVYTFTGMTLPGPLQWSLTTPSHAEELQFRIEDYGDSAGSVIAHVRRDEPVEVSMEFNMAEMRLDVDFVADASFDVTREELTLTPDSEYALEGDSTYYFALEFECPNGCLIRARGDVIGGENEPPQANAGDDQEVELWDEVLLDGSGSSDPEGDELTFAWEKVSGRPIELDGANTAQATFVAEESGTFEFELTVTDPEGAIGQDTVTITVAPEPESETGPEVDGGTDGGADGGVTEVDARPVMSATGGSCDCAASGSSTTGVERWIGLLGF